MAMTTYGIYTIIHCTDTVPGLKRSVQKNHRTQEPAERYIPLVTYTIYGRYGRITHIAYVSNLQHKNQYSTLSTVFWFKNVKYETVLNAYTEKQGKI